MDHLKNIYPLYDSSAFHDACGTGFIVTLSGKPEKRVLPLALKGLQRLDHRGAISADKETGDGSGVLTNIPHLFFREILKEELGIRMPLRKKFSVGMVFTTSREIKWLKEIIKSTATINGFNVLAMRKVKVNPNALGKFARNTKPLIIQFFLVETQKGKRPLETRLYLLRKTVEKEILTQKKKSYICSFSSETIVYKGLMTSTQLDHFYPDLTHPKYVVKLALFHERFSTNTQSTWSMAQPFRMLAHNGEINTIKANRLWMTAREREIKSRFWNDDLENLKPIVNHHLGHNMPLATIGVFLLWFGWYGFNGGSVLSADPGGVSLVFVTTTLAAAAGIIGAMITSWYVSKKPDLSMILNGSLAGLVGITAGADVVSPMNSVLVGFIAGVIVVLSVIQLDKLKIDDPVGAISVHLVCGIWGTLAVGIFSAAHSFYVQALGVGAYGIFCLIGSILIFAVVKYSIGLRVSEDEEIIGLDIGEHDMESYAGFQIFTVE